MTPNDVTSSSFFQPINRLAASLSEAWRFLTRPVSADFHNDPEAHGTAGPSHRDDDKDEDRRFSAYFNWHHS